MSCPAAGRRDTGPGGAAGIFLWDTATGKQSPVLPVNKTAPVSLAFGPGNRLVWSSADGRLHVCDTASGTDRHVLTLGSAGLRLYPIFRGDGLCCAGSNGAVYRFSLAALDDARAEEVLLVLLRDSRPGVAWKPSGPLTGTASLRPLPPWRNCSRGRHWHRKSVTRPSKPSSS